MRGSINAHGKPLRTRNLIRLIRPSPRSLNHLAPQTILRANVVAKFGSRTRHRCLRQRLQAFVYIGLLQRAYECGIEFGDQVRRRASRHEEPVPFTRVTKIHTDAARALQSAEVRDKLAADGAEAVSSTLAEFTRFIRGELEKWGRVIKAAGLRAD